MLYFLLIDPPKDQPNQIKKDLKAEKTKNKDLEVRIRDLELDLTRIVQEHHNKEATLNSRILELESSSKPSHLYKSTDESDIIEELKLKLEAYETEVMCCKEIEEK